MSDSRFEYRTTAAGVRILVPRAEEAWVDRPASPKTVEEAYKRGLEDGAAAAAGAGAGVADGSGAAASAASAGGQRELSRLIKSKGPRIDQDGGVSQKLGGEFKPSQNAPFIARRSEYFDELFEKQEAATAAKPREDIVVFTNDGKGNRTPIEGCKAWETTPMSIASGIAKSLAKACVVAKVTYTRRVASADSANISKADDDEVEEAPDSDDDGAGDESKGGEAEGGDGAAAGAGASNKPELWDMTRPLEGDCEVQFLKFADEEGKTVFWHSSAHVLGQCLEQEFGVHLTVGPPTEDGFYYDCYMGDQNIADKDYASVNKRAAATIKAKQPFQRLVLTKEEALELFKENPFKVQLITNKVPDGGRTSAYKCGPLIDLCMGPHVPSTGTIGAFEVVKNSSAYWLANADNDSLQRLYAVAFPDKKEMKLYKKRVEEAKQRDHRVIGVNKQELFFFHDLSPGSCFFLPAGARVYNRLTDFIRGEYRRRGFTEVITPNMFNVGLWETSGHAQHYLENMFSFDVEKELWALKPMNCPAHCLMFKHRLRSYRDLPLRLADFGVLHRNEFSGALTGLTRVRRFQQDDAHIFARHDQIGEEVQAALEFMKYCYDTFGFTFELLLSTRPKKALGSKAVWREAERMMAEALNIFCDRNEGLSWKINPGDGAFYGPKIDIQVFDALGRRHQCATIQLDFQLPIRFGLSYKAAGSGAGDDGDAEGEGDGDGGAEGGEPAEAADGGGGDDKPKEKGGGKKGGKKEKKKKGKKGGADGSGGGKDSSAEVEPEEKRLAPDGGEWLHPGFERPVIIHRAILGSVERCIAILIEHYGGKWPLWLSPRQVMVVPVANKYNEFAENVRQRLHDAGFLAEAELSSKTMNKKVREAQMLSFNYILCVGEAEASTDSVAIRKRDMPKGERPQSKTVDEFIAFLKEADEKFATDA